MLQCGVHAGDEGGKAPLEVSMVGSRRQPYPSGVLPSPWGVPVQAEQGSPASLGSGLARSLKHTYRLHGSGEPLHSPLLVIHTCQRRKGVKTVGCTLSILGASQTDLEQPGSPPRKRLAMLVMMGVC